MEQKRRKRKADLFPSEEMRRNLVLIHMTTIGYDAIMSLKIRNGVTLHDVSIYDTGRRNGDCSFTNR